MYIYFVAVCAIKVHALYHGMFPFWFHWSLCVSKDPLKINTNLCLVTNLLQKHSGQIKIDQEMIARR